MKIALPVRVHGAGGIEDTNRKMISYADIAEALNGQRWIPVSTLPKNDHDVLCLSGGRQYVGYYHQTHHQWFPGERVTHWQPLPLPPGDDK